MAPLSAQGMESGVKRLAQRRRIGDLAGVAKAERARDPGADKTLQSGEFVGRHLLQRRGADIRCAPMLPSRLGAGCAFPHHQMPILAQQAGLARIRNQPLPGGHRVGKRRAQRRLAMREPRRGAGAEQLQREGQPGRRSTGRQRQRAAAHEQAPGNAADGRARGERLDLLGRDMPGIPPGCAAPRFVGRNDRRPYATPLERDRTGEAHDAVADHDRRGGRPVQTTVNPAQNGSSRSIQIVL
jgi:hypothetical protein